MRTISSEVASASPVAVPPLGFIASLSASRSAARSVVGLWTASARLSKTTPPTRTRLGTLPRNASPASSAAVSREGATSVAAIEPEWSMASTIVACSAGTATLTCGRASAAISAAVASPASASGTWRRKPGPARDDRCAQSAGAANAAAARRRRRSLATYAASEQRQQDEAEQQPGRLERHGVACSGRSPSLTFSVSSLPPR